MKNILDYNIYELQDKLKKGNVTSTELTKACLKQIEETKELNSLISVNAEYALSLAEKADKEIAEGKSGALLGVPVIVKDNLSTTEFDTTCASKMLEGYRAPYNAMVVQKLLDAGAVILGKANMDEFAMGGSGENSAFGKTLNPLDPSRVPGGSSSGSACAVASKQCYASLGSDTGGSIRQPSSFCGVVGLKPTYGRVSRYGLVAFASSLDQVGPITKCVKDSAIMLEAICGYDKHDGTTIDGKDVKFVDKIRNSVRGLKIGVAKEYFDMINNKEVKKAIEDAVEFYRENGAEIVNISLPSVDKALADYYILSSAEASSNLARYDGIKYGKRAKDAENLLDIYYNTRTKYFGKEVKRRIMLGNYCLSAGYHDQYYNKAQEVRNALKQEFAIALKKCDAIISPTAPTTAFKFGEKATPLDMYLADIFTVPANLTGLPAISFKVGKDENGMPIGCQLIANYFEEGTLFNLANYYEVTKELK